MSRVLSAIGITLERRICREYLQSHELRYLRLEVQATYSPLLTYPSMSKSVSAISFTAQLITVDTDLPLSEVTARLDHEINNQGTDTVVPHLANVKSKAEAEEVVNSWTGPSGLVFFEKKKFTLPALLDEDAVLSYTIGNPLTAYQVLGLDKRAAAFIPPRIAVLEKEGGKGTQLVYYLPSSLVGWSDDEELVEAVKVVDGKLERMMDRITSLK
ncbi:hypothetical protein BDQ17DRAFT_1457318 [Cyathus striatus]|nr:hypothetical protein BDQ17DRAFT_1457318 [Cyathus striatus]